MTQGPTLSDSRGDQRIRNLKKRSGYIDDQIRELRDKRRVMLAEMWEYRADGSTNAVWWAVCRVMMHCYR